MAKSTGKTRLDIPAPEVLLQPFNIPDRLLTGPGPSNCPPRVLRALGNQVLGHLHPETCQLMDEIKEGLRYAFQTRNRLTLALSASGHAGMEACLGNLLEPGETVLIVVAGIWGERAADMATRIGAHVELLVTRNAVAFGLDELKTAIERTRPEVVFVVHGESSHGLKQPLEGVGALVRRYGGLFVVDTVASLGGEPFYADAWYVDAVYTGSQKVLGAPAGITPISFGPRAERKMFARRSKVHSYYMDMRLIGEYWNCFGKPRIYHHTISATLVYGLRESLAILAAEGLEASWARHASAMKKLGEALASRRLQFHVKNPAHRLTTVAAIEVPPGVDWRVVTRRAMEKWNVEISGGLGVTVGKIFRIGLMGVNAREEVIDRILFALDEAIKFSRAQKL